ncbi:MAG TPA: DUF4988 domain-containing protein [Candidatus Phocaeicola gallinarum]|nr:DUF4988 domain-containing protein [Candidatus Phocaeicola gallinarum]
MNKKFVGALLLGSLIMAGGTFTGCSDYDDDINSVNERVDEVRSVLDELQTQVNEGLTISGVEKTDNGVIITMSDGNTYELTNGENGVDGTTWEIGEDGYWYKNGTKTDYQAIGKDGEKGDKGDKGDPGEPGTPGTGVAGGIYYYPGTEGEFEGFWVKVEIDAEGNKTESNSGVAWTNPVAGGVSVVWDIYSETLTVDGVEEGTVVINLSRILKALVFAPELYLDGVEATKYEYLDGNYVTLEGQVAGDYFDELKGEVVRYNIPDLNRPVAAGAYTLGSKDEVVYHMNPSSAAEDDYSYRFLYDNPEYISTRANGAGVTVNYLDKVKEDGDLKVTYQLQSPELLAGKGGEHTESSNISVMALEAKTLNASEEKTITSDYAALVPVVESLQAIAFIDHTTLENAACPKDLYNTGEEALKNDATLDWEYNGGTLDLSQLLQVHYLSQNWTLPTPSGVHQSMGYEEVVERYGLKWQYQMLPYTLGTNQTSESMYGMVDQNTGEFTPCMVIGENDGAGDETGNGNITQQPIAEGSEEGVSAIGRRPIVLVTLENEAGDIVLAGYIKINITREMNETGVVVDSWEAPYVCDGFSNTFSWADMSDEVIEMLHMSISDFRDAYSMVRGETYIKDANNEMKLVSGNIYGTMIEHKDAQVPTTNDVVEWAGSITELDNILAAATNREFTLYAKFISNKDGGINYVYVGMTIKVVEAPEVKFVERIDRYWYPESLAKEERDTVRMNVPRPTNAGIGSWEVLDYFKDIDEYYVGNQVQIELTDAPQNVWYNLTTLGTNYYFRFAATQDNLVGPAGETYILSTNLAGSILYANGTAIAEINRATGVLDYQDNPTAKEVLNLWGHAYPNTYAKVTLVATYDDCGLPLGDETFNVRFLRPLDITPGNDANFIDAQANGSEVFLGDLFGLVDWRDQAVIVGSLGTYTSAMENGCPLYDYYHIGEMRVLLDDVTCNLNGNPDDLLSVVAPSVDLSVNGGTISGGVAYFNIANANDLNNFSIVYRNNEANVRDFDMIIPVEIEYAWGTLKGEIKAHVDATMANE